MKIIEITKNYFRGVYREMKQVIWASRKETTNNTLTVIVAVILAMVFFGLVDYGLVNVMGFLFSK